MPGREGQKLFCAWEEQTTTTTNNLTQTIPGQQGHHALWEKEKESCVVSMPIGRLIEDRQTGTCGLWKDRTGTFKWERKTQPPRERTLYDLLLLLLLMVVVVKREEEPTVWQYLEKKRKETDRQTVLLEGRKRKKRKKKKRLQEKEKHDSMGKGRRKENSDHYVVEELKWKYLCVCVYY